MAIAVVQAVSTTGIASTALTLSGLTTTSGNLYAAAIVMGGANPVSSVTDSASNAWIKQAGNAVNHGVEIWTTTAASPSAITTVTANVGSSTLILFEFYEISGALSNTLPVDVSATNNDTITAASTTATRTPAYFADLAIGVVGWELINNATADSGATFTDGVGTNNFIDFHSGVTDLHISTSTLVLTGGTKTAQTFTTTLSNTPTAGYGATIVLLKGLGSTGIDSGNYRNLKVGTGMGRSDVAS